MIDRDTIIAVATKYAICTSGQHKEFLHEGLFAFVDEIAQAVTQKAVEGERERAAQIADSAGHHWSGAPAIAMFDIAEAIRNRGIGGGE